MNFTMWGKTEQVKTTGAQLIPPMFSEKKVINGITFEPISANEAKVYGTATKDCVMPYNYFTVKPGTYTLSINQKVAESKFRACLMNKEGRPKLNILNVQSSSTGVFDTEEQFTVLLRIYQGVEINMNICFMLNEGDSATPYESYSGDFPSPSPDWEQPIEVTDQPITVTIKGGTEQQSVTLVPPRPLTKWDKLEKVDGTWKWVYKSGKEVLKGDDREGWTRLQTAITEKHRFYPSILKNKIVECANDKIADIFCTHYIAVSANDTYTASKNGVSIQSDGALLIYDEKHATGSIVDFAKALSGNPITVYYEAIDTEYLPLPQPVQDKLNALTMYAGTTEIANDGGCTMELTYTVDTQSYVDSKIAEIGKVILIRKE